MTDRHRIHPRWAMGWTSWKGPMGKVQVDSLLRRERRDGPFEMPEPILRLAQDEYDRQFPGQPYKRMQERGGLSITEVVTFLADRIERVEKLGPWAEREATDVVADAPDSAPDDAIGALTEQSEQ